MFYEPGDHCGQSVITRQTGRGIHVRVRRVLTVILRGLRTYRQLQTEETVSRRAMFKRRLREQLKGDAAAIDDPVVVPQIHDWFGG